MKPAKKDVNIVPILVCHGAEDKFIPAEHIAEFHKEMKSLNADYKFVAYPDAVHSFTNPDADAFGKKFEIPLAYNAAADKASWKDMKAFLTRIFK